MRQRAVLEPSGGWRREPDGGSGRPDVPAAARDAGVRAVSVAEEGDAAVAVWRSEAGSVVAAHRAAGRWGPARTLSPSGLACTGPVLARSGDRVVAAWVDETTRAVVRDGSVSGGWAGSTVLTEPWSGTAGLRVAVIPGGPALAVWTARDAVVRVAESPAPGRWDAPAPLSEPGEPAYGPAVAASAEGAAVAWMHAGALVRLATRPVAGSWTAAATVSPEGDGGLFPSVAAGGAGAVLVAWPGEDGRVGTFVGRIGAAGGTGGSLGEGRGPVARWRDGAFEVEWDAG